MFLEKRKRCIYHLVMIIGDFILTAVLLASVEKYLGLTGLEHSIWSVLLFASIYLLTEKYQKVRKRLSKRKKRFIWLFCACLGVAEISGIYLIKDGSILAYNILAIGMEFLMIVALAVLLFLIIAILTANGLPIITGRQQKKHGNIFTDWFIIMLGWLPVLLAYYPGIFAYDASNQVSQVLTGVYSTHHPLMHTFLLGGLFKLGHALGSNNFGVLLYCLIQMSILAWTMVWALDYMRKKGLDRKLYLLIMAFYVFFPVNSMLAISTTKDILFAAFCLVVMIFLMKVSDEPKLWKNKGLIFIGGLGLIGMMLFRNNALYACILCCPLLCVFGKKEWKKYFGWIITCLVLTLWIRDGTTAGKR